MMSYAEKPEDITKDEWMDKLNNVHIQRADMNRLIMNYLVTGSHNGLFCTQTELTYAMLSVNLKDSLFDLYSTVLFEDACV